MRVRILLDDVDARAKDDLLRVADSHPNVEMRIFNPIYSEGIAGGCSEICAHRLNRRMHNKAWIADDRVAIIGGRNIGDQYFGASDQSNFADLDVMMTGPVVERGEPPLDVYWNSAYSGPGFERFDGGSHRPRIARPGLIRDAKEYRRHRERDAVRRRAARRAEARGPAGERGATAARRRHQAARRQTGKDGPGSRSGGLRGPRGVVSMPSMADAKQEVLIVSALFMPGTGGTAGALTSLASVACASPS